MKPLYAPVIVSLALMLGCAKNSDVEKLQSQLNELQPQIKELQDQQLEVTTDLRNKLNTAEAKLFDLKREVERMKESEAELVSAAKVEREAEREDAQKSLHAEFAELTRVIAAITKPPVTAPMASPLPFLNGSDPPATRRPRHDDN